MKKVGKKIVSAVLAASLLITGGSLSFASEQEPIELMGGMGLAEAGNQAPEEETKATALTGISATEEALFEARMLSQEEALEAHSLLWASFPKDENGWPSSYPEDYAGCYIDEASDLVILLVNPTEESKEAYKELCGNSSRVKFKAAQYSMEELESYNDEAMKLYEEGYDLVSWGVDEKENTFDIEVKEEDYQTVKNQFVLKTRSISIPVEVTAVKEGPVPTADMYVYGGQGFTGGNGGTICVGGTYNGKDAILTAGHCVNYVDEKIMMSGSTPLGTVRRRKFLHQTPGDYAIIELSTLFGATNKIFAPTSGQTHTIKGAYPNAPVGTAIRKHGNETKYSYGTIEKMNNTGNYNGTLILNLGSALMTGGSSSIAVANGDSGGPVYVLSGGQYLITGLVSGRDKNQVGNKYRMYFCDISYPTGVGFKIKTS